MDKKNQWKTALLDRLRRADIEFADDITPDAALDLFCQNVFNGIKRRVRQKESRDDDFPDGVLLLKDMSGLSIEGASSEVQNDPNPGTRYPVLILSRAARAGGGALYIVLQDKTALRDFQTALTNAALAIMYPEDTTAADNEDTSPADPDPARGLAEQFIELLRELKAASKAADAEPPKDE